MINLRKQWKVEFHYKFSEKDGGYKGVLTVRIFTNNEDRVIELARKWYYKHLYGSDASFGKQFAIVVGNCYYHKFFDVNEELYYHNEKIQSEYYDN